MTVLAGDQVLWHDLECGAYTADLPLWRELADAAAGPVLDVGAGTGRVALELARRGHRVVALDRDGELLAALAERAGAARLDVECRVADARDFELDRRFALIVVPMQTIQLLGGAADRAGFLAAAARHLRPGGRLAAALAVTLEDFAAGDDRAALPLPDLRERDGYVYASQPVAIRTQASAWTIERIRQTVSPAGERSAHANVVRLHRLGAAQLEDEGHAAGLAPDTRLGIAATDEHVGSEVVVLRG